MLGLLMAPLARPAMAVTTQAVIGHTAMEMPADMPCCPEQAPAKDCAKDCSLMATCMAGGLQAMPPFARVFTAPKTGGVTLSGDDVSLSGLRTGPPQRPPKT